jgi:2-methylcitrate dehydratase PrpD
MMIKMEMNKKWKIIATTKAMSLLLANHIKAEEGGQSQLRIWHGRNGFIKTVLVQEKRKRLAVNPQ